MIGTVNLQKGKFLTGRSEALIQGIFKEDLAKNSFFKALDKASGGKLSKKAKTYDFTGKKNQVVTIEDVGSYGVVTLFGLGKRDSFAPLTLRRAVAKALVHTSAFRAGSTDIHISGEWGTDIEPLARNIALAFHLASYRFDKYKAKKKKDKDERVAACTIYTDSEEQATRGIRLATAQAEGIYLTRDLVNEPASEVTPERLNEEAHKIAKASKGRITVKTLGYEECRRLGMGAYLGDAQGSEHPPKFITLVYNPAKGSKKSVALIGKSITFDSGGLSLKPSEHMSDMKLDMAGGATVLGVFQALSELSTDSDLAVSHTVIGVLPACENMPSGRAQRPGDIVRTISGKTIEVLNTDAEGRLTLADALEYTLTNHKPDVVIDMATLTGACMVALGTDIAGVFANDNELCDEFLKAAKQEGDESWRLPLYKKYKKHVKSSVADLKNIGGGRYGGAITAALFLQEFVGKTPWIHIDMAGPAFRTDAAGALLPKGGTGWGVLSVFEYLRNG